MSAIEWARVTIVPLVTAGTTIWLFRLKLYADARKRLDDLLIELEHDLYAPEKERRTTIFRNRYLEIRKAVSEYERWILDPLKKRNLQKAFQRFHGQDHDEHDIMKIRGTEFEYMIDVFWTNNEIRCLAPDDQDYPEYMIRIAELRKITGSRVWPEKAGPII